MKAITILISVAILSMVGCTKNPTAPQAEDKFIPMTDAQVYEAATNDIREKLSVYTAWTIVEFSEVTPTSVVRTHSTEGESVTITGVMTLAHPMLPAYLYESFIYEGYLVKNAEGTSDSLVFKAYSFEVIQ